MNWVSLYLESSMKPIFISNKGEKLSQVNFYMDIFNKLSIIKEIVDNLLEYKKKINKEEIFFESQDMKGLFFYEFLRGNEKIFVLYKFDDINEENIYYNYFK